ncbi:MAG TPA: UbiA family prenyltransferase [Candidatus Lokiarchaeia archaeon]|nr:UbiA family prenyltransferase [Candidatus Lokiarchaeia archaeon]
MVTRKQKIIAWLKATRAQFLFAYFIISLGGIMVGFALYKFLPSFTIACLSFVTIIVAAIGINFRDEAADWITGYDAEHGGVGVIREGFLSAKSLEISGRFIDTIALILAFYQVILVPVLLYVFIPATILVLGANYLTEEIFLGHELSPALSFALSFIWVYLAQGWQLTLGILLFFLFVFVVVFALVPYQDIGDYESDKKTGKKTLTVKLGVDGVGQFSILMALMAMLLLYFSINALII